MVAVLGVLGSGSLGSGLSGSWCGSTTEKATESMTDGGAYCDTTRRLSALLDDIKDLPRDSLEKGVFFPSLKMWRLSETYAAVEAIWPKRPEPPDCWGTAEGGAVDGPLCAAVEAGRA